LFGKNTLTSAAERSL
jgi:ribosomal protein S13